MESRSFHPVVDLSAVPRVPVWGRARGTPERDVDAAFLAGAALNCLDNLVRSHQAWSGVWRQRLALKGAAAASRLLGRREDEAALRDGFFFRMPGDDPGPAGKLLIASRRIASRSMAVGEEAARSIAEHLEVKWDDALRDVVTNAEDMSASARPAPLLAAELAAEVYRARPDAELLAFCLADLLLAQKLRWGVPVPLLMGQLHAAPFRLGEGRRRVRPGGEGWSRAVLLAYAVAAAEACDLGADLAARAVHLSQIEPRLRSRGAGAVVKRLLEDDAVPSSRPGALLTDRSARRLFERLSELGAVRELSGRATFRLYGL